jgi:hypothetical protein
MASLEKSRNSLQTGVGAEALFILRCDRSPVMLTGLAVTSGLPVTQHGTNCRCPYAEGKKRMSKILKACRGFWIGRAWEA